MPSYFVLYRCEDEPYLLVLTEDELKKRLSRDKDGYSEFGDCQFLDELPDTLNIEEFPANSVLIIKGKAIVPSPKKVVTEFSLGD